MNPFEDIKSHVIQTIIKLYPQIRADMPHVTFDYNTNLKRKSFGDLSSNIPFVLSKLLSVEPQKVGADIIEFFSHAYITKVEYAGNGFLNFYCIDEIYSTVVHYYNNFNDDIIQPSLSNNERYNIEFVSANPTGPLHIGHGRGGVIGDVFTRVLGAKGIAAESEFYINDAGNQIEKLGNSLFIRYKALCGEITEFPEDGYHGEYINEMAQDLFRKHEKELLIEKTIAWFSDYAKEILLKNIQTTLKNYDIVYDTWFSEKTLHNSRAIDEAVGILNEKGYIYFSDDKTMWFKSTEFGDEKDRVVKKGNGEWTYVAADIAYLKNKLDRGFTKIVMVLGQDHHSYKVRLEGIIQALGESKNILHIILYQLVTIKEDGELVKLSKRAGKIVELTDIIDAVGKDVARYFYLNKKADAHLTFDLVCALEQNDQNPVFYIQYAYVRIMSILKKYDHMVLENLITKSEEKNFTYVYDALEKTIIRKSLELDLLLDAIVNNYQIHLLAYYMHEYAQLFHNFYNANTCIKVDQPESTHARIMLLKLMHIVFSRVADIVGMSKLESM